MKTPDQIAEYNRYVVSDKYLRRLKGRAAQELGERRKRERQARAKEKVRPIRLREPKPRHPRLVETKNWDFRERILRGEW